MHYVQLWAAVTAIMWLFILIVIGIDYAANGHTPDWRKAVRTGLEIAAWPIFLSYYLVMAGGIVLDYVVDGIDKGLSWLIKT